MLQLLVHKVVMAQARVYVENRLLPAYREETVGNDAAARAIDATTTFRADTSHYGVRRGYFAAAVGGARAGREGPPSSASAAVAASHAGDVSMSEASPGTDLGKRATEGSFTAVCAELDASAAAATPAAPAAAASRPAKRHRRGSGGGMSGLP
jgi:hypothetical protein